MADRPRSEPQSARAVLMVRPAAFGSNPLTAASNRFQRDLPGTPATEVQQRALREFDALAAALDAAGIAVCVADDAPEPIRPDAIFPNNWVSFHADGTAVLYPLMAENRRLERRMDILETLSRSCGFRIERTVDLTHHENSGAFLEGTGSLVLDRVHRLAFACPSPRTDLEPLGDFAQQLDYEIVSFEGCDAGGTPVYHTNVLMGIGERFAVFCTDAVRDSKRRAAVVRILEDGGHEVLELTHEQMQAFAGNLLELENDRGEKVIAMSETARQSLSAEQCARLERHGRLLAHAIPTIERCGGGSVRCMLAEIHLPRRH